jgi:hypothetical protein
LVFDFYSLGKSSCFFVCVSFKIDRIQLEVVPLRGRYAILAERKDNLFADVVCGRGDCAGMTYVISANGLLCQFDEHRQMRSERDLQVRSYQIEVV